MITLHFPINKVTRLRTLLKRGTGKLKMRTKPNLNPSPFSNFLSYSLFGPHFHVFFPCARSPIPFPRFPLPVLRFPVTCSLFPVPCTLFAVPRSPFPVPCSPFLVSVSRSTLNNIPRYIQHIFLQCRSPLSTGGSLNTILRCITKAFLRVNMISINSRQ